MSEAWERARLKALQTIKAAGDRDWRAHAKWPELSHLSDYRGSTKIDLSANALVSSVVTMTEERRMERVPNH